MARRVTWTEAALQDLEAAAEFIARDSPRYAAALVRDAREAARSLTSLSKRARRTPEANEPNVRELFVGRYRMIFEIVGTSVYIVAFIHGARDLAAIWDQRHPPEGRDE